MTLRLIKYELVHQCSQLYFASLFHGKFHFNIILDLPRSICFNLLPLLIFFIQLNHPLIIPTPVYWERTRAASLLNNIPHNINIIMKLIYINIDNINK